MVEVTKPILSVSCLSEHGIGTHRAREPFAYEQEIHKIPGNSCARAGDSQYYAYKQEIQKIQESSCVRAGDHACEQEVHIIQEESCVRAGDSQKSCVRGDGLQNSAKSCV